MNDRDLAAHLADMTLTAPALVYKSQTPAEHLAILERNRAARTASTAAMQHLSEALVPGSDAYAFHSVSGAVSMTGIKVDSDTARTLSVPAGLRWDTKARGQHLLVPAKRTEGGRALVKRMVALDYRPESLGAVSQILAVTDGVHDYWGCAVFETIDGDVYATYARPLSPGPRDKGIVDADPAWSHVPLSEFYTARETAAARALWPTHPAPSA